MTSKSPEFSQFRRPSRLRRRSRSAAVIAVQLDADHRVGGDDVDADFNWDKRRQSANSDEPSSRLSTWLQRRLVTFGSTATAQPIVDDQAPTAAVEERNSGVKDRPQTTHGCSAAAPAATTSPPDVLDVGAGGHDCKCVSC